MSDLVYERQLARLALEAEMAPRELTLADLDRVRRMKGVTQTALGARMFKSQSDISSFERRRDFKISQFHQYMKALGFNQMTIVCEQPAGPDVHFKIQGD